MLKHWRYCSLALRHRYVERKMLRFPPPSVLCGERDKTPHTTNQMSLFLMQNGEMLNLTQIYNLVIGFPTIIS